ncbi:MAG TPA: hypothetical protein VJB93_01330, partial [Patescibacteria group bacterium]|nr:hypothetical protein [Patescibacteria group bacterium]
MKLKMIFNRIVKFVLELFLIASAIAIFVLIIAVTWNAYTAPSSQTWGATFSIPYAEYLGLDWKKVFTESMDDLGIRLFRIPVYWNIVERQQGVYDWTAYDWIVDEAEKRNASLVFVIGNRVPRWPECHPPQWAQRLSAKKRNQAIEALLRETVSHFKGRTVIVRWQVENEPFLQSFGECPPLDEEFLKKEVELVRTIDPSRKVQITESGELSSWLRGAQMGDVLGISMYRTVYNSLVGFGEYPFGGMFYKNKAQYVKNLVDDVVISELQAEPWGPDAERDQPIIMTPEQMKKVILI